jgi:hypothetical protein
VVAAAYGDRADVVDVFGVRPADLAAVDVAGEDQRAQVDAIGVNGRCVASLPAVLPHGAPKTARPPINAEVPEYRYGDSNPGFRRERAAS